MSTFKNKGAKSFLKLTKGRLSTLSWPTFKRHEAKSIFKDWPKSFSTFENELWSHKEFGLLLGILLLLVFQRGNICNIFQTHKQNKVFLLHSYKVLTILFLNPGSPDVYHMKPNNGFHLIQGLKVFIKYKLPMNCSD